MEIIKDILCYRYELRLMQSMTRVCEDILENENLSEKVVFLILNRWSIMSKRMWERMKECSYRAKGKSIFYSIKSFNNGSGSRFIKYQGYELKLTDLVLLKNCN